MKVVVFCQDPGEDATVDDQDVLVQRDAVVGALDILGHEAICISCSLDLECARQQLLAAQPDVVFNLVESLGGTDRLMVLATLLMDAMEIPYTGSRTDAILVTAHKLMAKKSLRQFELPTPPWLAGTAACLPSNVSAKKICDEGNGTTQWILKPVLEHASFGIDDEAVVQVSDFQMLESKLLDRQRLVGCPHFAEQFIEGREFNLSLLRGHVLPLAEIDFISFPPDKPRIVGYQAKWDVDSFEYQQTPRRFEFPIGDEELLQRLSELARTCWRQFGLTGYARVDFRVDGAGQPWILEINVNPCLSPDAGFAAAISQSELTFAAAIQQIIDDAFTETSPFAVPNADRFSL